MDVFLCVLCKWNNIYLSLLNLRECRMAGRLWRRFHKCSVSSAQAATKAPCSRKNIDMIINSAIHSVLPYILLWSKITLMKFNFFTMSDFWCSSFSQFWSIFAAFCLSPKRNVICSETSVVDLDFLFIEQDNNFWKHKQRDYYIIWIFLPSTGSVNLKKWTEKQWGMIIRKSQQQVGSKKSAWTEEYNVFCQNCNTGGQREGL